MAPCPVCISHFPGTYTCLTHVWGVVILRTTIEERACDLAVWIIDNRATVRAAAKHFQVSKSTVHKDMTERLKSVDRNLYEQVRLILEQNKAERHLRGGDATRRKYKGDELS